MWKPTLDKMVKNLNAQGVADTPYQDRNLTCSGCAREIEYPDGAYGGDDKLVRKTYTLFRQKKDKTLCSLLMVFRF